MSEGIKEAGWYTDPTGRFDERYHDGAAWTEQVARDGERSSDALQAPPATPTGGVATAPVPGTAAVVSLPDDPASTRRRQIAGWSMIGAAALVLLSLVFPWVSGAEEYSEGPVTTLAGYQYGMGLGVGFFALLLIAYAVQAIVRPRVRFHIGALVVLVFMLLATFLHAAFIEDDDLDRLGVSGSGSTESLEVFGGAIRMTGPGDEDEPFANADRVDSEIGVTVAAIGELAAFVPLVFLWRDDRRRRREAGLLL